MSELDDAPSPLEGDSPAPNAPEYLSSDNALILREATEPWTSPFTGQENRIFSILDIHNRDHGSVGVEYDPRSGDVRVHSMDARNLDRGLTHVHAADLLYDLRKVYPQAKSISGIRMTGARGAIRPETKIPWPQETDPGTPGRRAGGLSAPPERISAAAITYGGQTYTGPTHYDAVVAAAKATGHSVDAVTDVVQYSPGADGFVTSTGRFVDRPEAMRIAGQGGQIKPGETPKNPNDFTSENMLDENRTAPLEPARAPMTTPPATGSPPGGYESPEMVGHLRRLLGPTQRDDPDAQNEKTP